MWAIFFQVLVCCPFKHLTHWGLVTHICVSELTIIGSDNGLSPGWRQAIIWTNAGILLIGSLGTNLSEILIKIYIFSFKTMHLKLSSGNWRPFRLGLNVLNLRYPIARPDMWVELFVVSMLEKTGHVTMKLDCWINTDMDSHENRLFIAGTLAC